MTPNKDAKGLGMPWEDLYGYAQAVKVGSTTTPRLALPTQLIEIKFVAKV